MVICFIYLQEVELKSYPTVVVFKDDSVYEYQGKCTVNSPFI